MERTTSHGCYRVSANYRGKRITACTNNSYAYDWCDDDEPNGITRKEARERMMDARRSLYSLISRIYHNA